jgi:hypothetical protein
MGAAVERLNVKLARTWVRPSVRRVDGKGLVKVIGHWREIADTGTALDVVSHDAVERLRAKVDVGEPELEQSNRDYRISQLAKGKVPEFLRAEHEHIAELVDRAHVTMQISGDAMYALIKGKALVPKDRSGGSDYSSAHRREVEKALFADSKPLYGVMRENPSTTGYLASLLNYGPYEIILKPSVRKDTTFSFGDSADEAFDTGSYGPSQRATEAPFVPQPLAGGGRLTDAYPYKRGRGSARAIKSVDKLPGGLGYVEAQIHRPITIDDVMEVREFSPSSSELSSSDMPGATTWGRQDEIRDWLLWDWDRSSEWRNRRYRSVLISKTGAVVSGQGSDPLMDPKNPRSRQKRWKKKR